MRQQQMSTLPSYKNQMNYLTTYQISYYYNLNINKNVGRLIIITGPSCIGKSPLDHALKRFYPEVRNQLEPLILWNSRDPRPGEIDGVQYHFRSIEKLKELKSNPDFVVIEVRGDTQALNIKELAKKLMKGDVFYEGNTYMAKLLIELEPIRQFVKTSMFISPLSGEEIRYLSSIESSKAISNLITEIMRRKLLRRTQKQKGILSLKDLENIEIRAKSAFKEMKEAHLFDFVIPNHDGEDSEHWNAFYYPIGDARNTLLSVKEIISDNNSNRAENWEADLLN